jgi:hypothetical protein
VAQTVGNVLDQILADAVVLQAVVQLLDDGLDDEDVGALVVAAHIVDLADLAAVADHIDGLAVILNVQPVTDLHTVTVDRQLLVVLDVVDHQGDQLLGELIGAIVVGAAGDVDGHTVGIVECHHEHIGAGLGGGVGAVGAQRGGLHEEALGTQSAVDLVGGDLQILFAFLPGLGIGIVPGFLCTLQQVHGAHDVALDKDLRVLDGAVHMALSGKVDDIIEIVLCKQALHQFLVADVALHEHMAGVALHVLQVLQIAGIGQLIQVDQQDLGVLLEHIVNKVGADKTGAAGDQIFFHRFILPQFSGFIFLGKLSPYFIPFSPSQWAKKQARASFQSRTSLPTVQRSIRLSSALHLGRSALSGCFALYSSLVQGATEASTPDRRMISEAKSYQEQMPSPVQ